MNAEVTLINGKEAAMQVPRILVVEDERIVARSLRKQLSALGYEVVGSVSSGEEAIGQAGGLQPDLVLMDINLEGNMDGVEAAAIIRNRFQLPVVFLTAYSNKEILTRAKVTEPFGYILKPYEDRELHVVIETALYKHRMEQRQRERERWFAATLKSIGDSVVATDDEDHITYMNPAAERLTGWASLEAFGRPLQEAVRLVCNETRQPVESSLDQATQAATPMNDTLLIARDGLEKHVETCVSLITDEQGDAVGKVTVLRDVTSRKHLEEQFLQARKMEAIGQLAGGVAHDFNNLLTIILGYSDMLLSQLKTNDPMRMFMKAISDAGERAASLTRQLLAFSRKVVLTPIVLNPNEIIRETEGLLRRLIGEDILLTTVLGPAISRVNVDPGLLGQVLMNLAVNARDAMPQGGKLTIESSEVHLDEAYAQRLECQSGHYVKLSVSDNGCGMTPEVKAHVFEPFFTTKGVGKGTGLGLATVYGILKQSGGGISLDSEPLRGTTFVVYLPAVNEQPRSLAHDQAAEPITGSETVLLVEDEDAVRAVAMLALQMQGYTVLHADCGVKAIEIIKKHQGHVDMLVTDVVMPGMSGRGLVENLSVGYPRLKVLYVSGHTDDSVIRYGIKHEEVAFLQKPYTPVSLARKVREVLDKQ
jgi:two-component system, cell cycle sensor histidine kinase and response regulator CckA